MHFPRSPVCQGSPNTRILGEGKLEKESFMGNSYMMGEVCLIRGHEEVSEVFADRNVDKNIRALSKCF